MAWDGAPKEKENYKNYKRDGLVLRAFPWLPPLQDKYVTGVFGLHYFDSIMSELVPWCHSAMAFHLYRLLSALVPTLWLLRSTVLKGFPKYLLQYELSLRLPAFLISLPSSILQVPCFGAEVSASEMVHRGELHLCGGDGCSASHPPPSVGTQPVSHHPSSAKQLKEKR